MLCIAWHPVTHQFPYENRMGLQWQLTCIQMFSLTHKHVFKLSRPTHGLQTSEPNRRGSFLNITIISLYCNARTDWLSPGETNTDPRVIQEVGSRRGDAIFARSANIHTRTCTSTHTHTLLYTLRRNTFWMLLCQPLRFLQSEAFLFDMAYNCDTEAELRSNCELKMDVRPALLWTAVWELKDKRTKLHEGFWGLRRERRMKHWWYRRPWDAS